MPKLMQLTWMLAEMFKNNNGFSHELMFVKWILQNSILSKMLASFFGMDGLTTDTEFIKHFMKLPYC